MADFENDYIMRLIKNTALLINLLVLRKSPQGEESPELDAEGDEPLETSLDGCLAAGDINRAENLLFEAVEEDATVPRLRTALNFYAKLARFSDRQLEAMGFSEDEIAESLEELKRIYNIELEGI